MSMERIEIDSENKHVEISYRIDANDVVVSNYAGEKSLPEVLAKLEKEDRCTAEKIRKMHSDIISLIFAVIGLSIILLAVSMKVNRLEDQINDLQITVQDDVSDTSTVEENL